MNRLSCFLACLLGAVFFVTAYDPCANDQGYRLLSISCEGYVFCENKTKQEVICETGTVLERDSMECMKIGTGNTSCGTIGDCKGREDGSNTEGNCQTFYECINKVYQANSRRYCPIHTLFDVRNRNCNYAWNIPEPCGTWKNETADGTQ